MALQSSSERSSVRMAPCVQLDPITERTSCKDGVRHTSIISGRILETDEEEEAEGEAMLCTGRGECLHEHNDCEDMGMSSSSDSGDDDREAPRCVNSLLPSRGALMRARGSLTRSDPVLPPPCGPACSGWSCQSCLGGKKLRAMQSKPIVLREFLDDEEVRAIIHAAAKIAPQDDSMTWSNVWHEGPMVGPTAERAPVEHHTLYLHRGGYFGQALPALHGKLVSRLRGAVEEMATGVRVGDATLSVRCIEKHTYQVGAGLMDEGHRDVGSVVTMSVLLSDPSEHDGGTFLTWDEAGRPVPHELGRGDAIVFNSEKVHNVSPITRGVRVALVLELWLAGPNVHDRNG